MPQVTRLESSQAWIWTKILGYLKDQAVPAKTGCPREWRSWERLQNLLGMNLKEGQAWQCATTVVKVFYVLWLSIPFLGVYPKGIITEARRSSSRQGLILRKIRDESVCTGQNQ